VNNAVCKEHKKMPRWWKRQLCCGRPRGKSKSAAPAEQKEAVPAEGVEPTEQHRRVPAVATQVRNADTVPEEATTAAATVETADGRIVCT